MKHKTNFRNLVIGHIAVIVILTGVLIFGQGSRNNFAEVILIAVVASLLIQFLIYRIKPSRYGNKMKSQS
jgi:hypothetical protein